MKAFKIGLVAAAVQLVPFSAQAVEYNFNWLDTDFQAVMNNTVTFGASWRIEDREDRLVGKSNLNPDLCRGVYQSCQGLHRTQSYPAARLRNAPGMASINFDDGNLNYDMGDITQAPFKLSQDLNIKFGNYGFFFRGIGIYDFINYNNFEETYPNRITAENASRTAIRGDGVPPNANPLSRGISNRYFAQVYGPGARTYKDRDEDEAQEIGLRYDLLDANFYGTVPLFGDRDLIFRIGRQTVNWGQSTVAVVNSVNQAQPVNANSLYRLGFGLLEELFVPVGMIRASTEVYDGLTVEAYYQYEWEPIEIPTPGSYMSFVDIGTDNLRSEVNSAFGGAADDPDSVGNPVDNPLTTITPTALTIDRVTDRRAKDSGQFGVSFKYYSETLNDGTEFGFYFMNYHSKLPYVSFISTNASCARREGNAMGIDARNTTEFLNACPNLPIYETNAFLSVGQDLALLQALTLADNVNRPGASVRLATELGTDLVGALTNAGTSYTDGSNGAVGFDTAKIFLEYPENLQMYGVDFTTTFGEYSFQGEVSYRPNVPLQVAIVDVAFAAFGPSLTRCHDPLIGCAGASSTVGFTENGGANYALYRENDFVDANGNNPYPDTINLIIGSAPGSARSFPNFIIPYRGGKVGENAPNSYIQGWIPGQVMQYNLGATRVLGNSENWIGADQVILLYELAATHVLNMPEFEELQIEGPLTAATHASAGADGSGADGSRLACSTNRACSVGPDGVRFNPFQAPRSAFADAFSWGYRIVGRISYESVLPGVSIQPLFIWSHDLEGNSPGPAGNFVEGRQSLNLLLETRYEKSYAFTISYNTFFGAPGNNLYEDRDNLGFFVKYQF